LFPFKFRRLCSFVLSVLEFFGLVHEGFESGQCIGLLLAIVGHVEDGMLLFSSRYLLSRVLTMVPGMQVKGMMLTTPLAPRLAKSIVFPTDRMVSPSKEEST